MAGDQSSHVDKDTCFTNYSSITSRAFTTSLILEFVGESRGIGIGTAADGSNAGGSLRSTSKPRSFQWHRTGTGYEN